MEIKVSVIMPSLNVADYIRECIESVINQTLREIEIICVDAGSGDGTRQILEEYAQRDARISIVDSNVRSYGWQVNKGISVAKGKYVAVLETDDFVLHDMYEKLFLLAEKNSLDYIMANFRSFYDDENAGRVYRNVDIFKDTPKIYNRILSLYDHAQIFNAGDVTLWRGIFSRKFLVANQIMLNETPGAAYQDICFLHRVRMKAQRSMYIDEYGYCYRTDREGSSMNSVKGLQYAKYEYQYLLDNEDIPAEYMGKIYYLMSASLLGETIKMLPKQEYLWGKEDAFCYEWFRKILSKAVDENLLQESMGAEIWWKRLRILLASKEDYTRRLKAVSDNRSEIETIAERASLIIVCGAGKRGASLIKLIKNVVRMEKNTNILCADNDSRLWDTYINGIRVVSIEMCVEKHPEAEFIIASKFGSDEIRNQLLSGEIPREHIHEYAPVINWD